MASSPLPPDLLEKFGILIARDERTMEDRRELRGAIDRLASEVHQLQLSTNAMTQTAASTATMVAGLAGQKLDERMNVMEGQMAHYRRFLGSAGQVLWKLILVELGSGAAGGIAAKLFGLAH